MALQGPFEFVGWLGIAGVLLLMMALSASHLRALPVSSSIIYLGVGAGLGPAGLGWLLVDFSSAPELLERLTEMAVIISLFVSGLKLRLPVVHPAWRAAYWLAGPVMLVCIVGVAAVAGVGFGLSGAAALLVGAILAPTDPVLASALSVDDARDADKLRYALSGEAGMNDGMPFPFVVFGLSWLGEGRLGDWVLSWALERVGWAVSAGVAVGYLLGAFVGRLAIWLRTREPDNHAPNDLLLLALICTSYFAAEQVGAWGFLAVFAAGLGLRRAELQAVQACPHPKVAEDRTQDSDPGQHPPAEHLVEANVEAQSLETPAVSAGVLVAESLTFGHALERMLEFLLVVIVGSALAVHWDPRAALLAVLLIFVIRPLAVLLCLRATPTSFLQRALLGWFGIRGIGSLYYLSYALTHGFSGAQARTVTDWIVTVVGASILLHGVTAGPLTRLYERHLSAAGDPPLPAAEAGAR